MSLGQVAEAPPGSGERYRIHPEYLVAVDPALGILGVLLEPATAVAKAWDHIEKIGGRSTRAPGKMPITSAGPIGLLAALLSVQRGYDTCVVDVVAEGRKPETVRGLGASYFHVGDLGEAAAEADIIIECSGVLQGLYAFLSDCETNALVAPSGQVEWLCVPRPDSASIFGALLDRSAGLFGFGPGGVECAARWRKAAEEIHADVCARGVDGRGVFVQHYGSTALDASALLIPLMGFLPPSDERVRATVLAIADELSQDGLALRYRVEATDDGLEGEEGTFTICSFWLVSALALIGEHGRARSLCEKLLSLASPLHLYAEELDAVSGQHLGNYPQAFTHLALIDAVTQLIELETTGPAPGPGGAPDQVSQESPG
jgi:hypothetical protein